MTTDKAGKGSRRPWTSDEDHAVHTLVLTYGTRKWTVISDRMKEEFGIEGRSGKQCRERWHNHLDPNIVKKPWDIEEEKMMFEAHAHLGNKWADIAKMLPGRSDNCIKNHFYSTVRKYCRKKLGVIATKAQIQALDQQATSSILASLKRSKGGRKRLRREVQKTPEETEENLWSEMEIPADLMVEGHKLFIPELPQMEYYYEFPSLSDEIFILPLPI